MNEMLRIEQSQNDTAELRTTPKTYPRRGGYVL
mgnify:CR=1 FL=1